jgi:superfamily II DNA or RNA helicase
MDQLLQIEDIAKHVFSFLPDKQLYGILTVNRDFYKLAMISLASRYRKNYLAEYYPSIFPEQSYAIKHMNKIRKSINEDQHYIIKYNSPMGTGKTAVGLYMALKSERKTLIIINPRTLSTWLGELKKMNLYGAEPLSTDVLFYHSTTNKKHYQYITNHLSEQKMIKHNTIITTFANYSKIGYRIGNILGDKMNIVVDEAHLLKGNLWLGGYTNYEVIELILISASPIPYNHYKYRNDRYNNLFNIKCQKMNINKDIINNRMNVDTIGGRYAKLTYQYFWLDSPMSELTMQKISKIFEYPKMREYNKIVLFSSTRIELLRSLAKRYKNSFEDYYVLAFNNSAKTHMDIFRKKEKCIVLCNYLNATEGVNFSEADCGLYLDFHYNTMEKAKQALGRIKRKNNIATDIDVYFVCLRDPYYSVYYIKTRLNHIFVVNEKIKLMEKKREYTMSQIITSLYRKKYKLTDLTDDEILLLFSNGSYDFSNLDIKIDIKDLLPLSYLV